MANKMVENNYEVFTVLCWQKKRFIELPCSLKIPFLPAFFCQEGLVKYKFDHKKYNFCEFFLDNYIPYCINNEGLVCIWLVDLGRMDYEDQLYWKSFEKPLSSNINFDQTQEQILESVLNKGFFESQCENNFDYLKTTLSIFKQTLQDLYMSGCLWWKADSIPRIREINYPIVKSQDDCTDWRREILSLWRLVIEGLDDKQINIRLKELEYERRGGVFSRIKRIKRISCKLRGGKRKGRWERLKKNLIKLGCTDAEEITTPLQELSILRNKVSPAHEQIMEKDKRKEGELMDDIIKKHNSYWKHYDYLVNGCNHTFIRLNEILTKK